MIIVHFSPENTFESVNEVMKLSKTLRLFYGPVEIVVSGWVNRQLFAKTKSVNAALSCTDSSSQRSQGYAFQESEL